jgi:hypothetical protein
VRVSAAGVSPATATVLAALSALAAALWSGEAAAGPWAIGQGRLFIDGRFTVSTASEIADQNGQHLPAQVVANMQDLGKTGARTVKSSVLDLNGEIYVEYGVLSRLTLTMNWQFARGLSYANPGGDVPYQATHVGDLDLGGRITVFDDELTLALYLGVGVPSGATGTNIPIGQGDVRTDFRVLVGKVIERWRIYVAGELGIRFRGSATIHDFNATPGYRRNVDYSDEIVYGIEAGYFWKTRRRGLQQILLGLKAYGKYSTSGEG